MRAGNARRGGVCFLPTIGLDSCKFPAQFGESAMGVLHSALSGHTLGDQPTVTGQVGDSSAHDALV